MQRPLLFRVLLLAACLLRPVVAQPAAAIDTAPLLRVGDWQVSGYLFEKYHHRFVEAEWQRAGVRPDAAANRRWLELFVARQVAAARAWSLGYGERESVRRVVDRMERTVLTQTDGLLEQSLFAVPGAPVEPPARAAWRAERRARQLAAAQLALAEPAAERLAARLAALPAGTTQIPAEAADRAALFAYDLGAGRVEVSGERFATYFNGLFIRRLPRNAADLRRAVEDSVIEECNLREARERGLDRTPQFIEDKRGFAGLQALELFEREQLLPAAKIGAEELERYHRENAAEFMRPVRGAGQLAVFADAAPAARWSTEGADPAKLATLARSTTRCEVSRTLAVPGLESFTEVLLTLPDGKSFGPMARGEEFLVFAKERTLERAVVPLAELAPEIRRRLEREFLDETERRNLAAWSAGVAVVARIDPARFGVSEPIVWPWRG